MDSELFKDKCFIGSCCGNSFIIVDSRSLSLSKSEKSSFAIKYIPIFDVDTVLFIIDYPTATIGIEVFERDGSESDSCGNGILLITHILGLTDNTIKMKESIVHVEATETTLALLIDLKFSKISGIGIEKDCALFKVGEPHLVYLVDEITTYDINNIAKKHANRHPNGVNIDLVQKVSEFKYRIKTHERGVNNVTKSCGTGSLSSYLALSFLNDQNFLEPIEFESVGGVHRVSRVNSMLRLETQRTYCEYKVLEL